MKKLATYFVKWCPAKLLNGMVNKEQLADWVNSIGLE
jgi:hypothetical protein